jgi:CBS domain-containing protein
MPNSSVKDVMLADPPCIAPHAPVRAAAKMMCALNASFLVVRADAGDALGLITDRDLTLLTASGRDPAVTRVCEAMSPHVVFCRDSDDVEDAAWLMERHEARRLIVLDGERRVVGVLSVDDLARGMTPRLAGAVLRHTTSLV